MEVLKFVLLICVILPRFRATDETDTAARLSNIESQLRTVLESNAELSQRVFQLERQNEALSGENKSIRETNIVMENKISKMQKNINSLQKSVHREGQISAKRPKTDIREFCPLGSGQTIVYDLTVTNVGGAYHNGSGVFTAPLNGVYVFNYAVMVDPGFSEYIELVKNGDLVIWNYGHAPGSNHLVSASRTATLELQAGDQVWTRTQAKSTHGDGIIHGNTFTTFSGWIVTIYE